MNSPNKSSWIFLMLVVLMTNGMGAFGLKVISSWGLPPGIKFPYLTVWYAAGLPLVGIPMLLRGAHSGLKEVGFGAIYAALSLGGQLAMSYALDYGVPGSVVYPVAVGGSILVVAVAGRLLFGGRMHPLSWTGIAIGIVAVILLSVSAG